MPPRRTTPKGYENARKLRKALTPAERKLWSRLRNNQLNGVSFRRQHAVGNYIPDFPWHRTPGRCVPSKKNSSSNWMAVNT
ncbi:MAG: DUF559 domain-containing protein [Chloroflexota bacterium]